MKNFFLFAFLFIPFTLLAQEFAFIPSELKKHSKEEFGEKIWTKDTFKNTVYYNGDGKILTDQERKELKNVRSYYFLDTSDIVKAVVFVALTKEEMEANAKKTKENFQQNEENSKLVGKKAFPFQFIDLNGNHYSNESLMGKVVVLNFWFTKCAPCIQEMPELNKLAETFSSNDVVFIAVTYNNEKVVADFLTKNAFKYNHVVNRKDACNAFNIQFYPSNIVLDKEGNFAFFETSFKKDMLQKLEKTIKKVLK